MKIVVFSFIESIMSKFSVTAASKYWQLVRLEATGRSKVEEIVSAREFLQKQFPELSSQIEVPDTVIQRQLLSLLDNSLETSPEDANNHRMTQICLRCFISHQIEQVCIQLELQFGREHGFNRYNLFSLVLDDTLDDLPDVAFNRANQSKYHSLSLKILETFDPQKASLSTWTTRLVKHNRELNAFLLEQGVYLISNWAILNDTTPKQVRRILAEFHNLTSAEIQQACFLIESYHAIYRRDRLTQRPRFRGKCPPPSQEQLERISRRLHQKTNQVLPPENVLFQIQELAELLRQYRIYVRSGNFVAQQSLDNPETNTEGLQASLMQTESESESEQREFLQFYRQQFLTSLDESIEYVVQNRISRLSSKSSLKAEKFLTALELFHCQGKSMGEIAPLVELKAQYQVSRLLKLKEFRADVRQKMLQQLSALTLARAANYAAPHQLQQLEQKVEAALSEQIGEVMQAAEAEAETSIVRNRSPASLFAQHLCRYLHLRES